MAEVREIGVVGAGFMGSGIAESAARAGLAVHVYEPRTAPLKESRRRIAESAARAGLRVRVYEPNPRPLESSRARIAASVERGVRGGKLEPEAAAALQERISFSTELHSLHGAEIVIEAIVEDLDEKRKVFRRLDDALDDGVILASNTSSIPIAGLAAATHRPQHVLGLHFFSPVPVMKLVEIVVALDTSAETIARSETFVQKLGKHPIRTRDRSGFIVNMLLVPYLMAAVRMYEDGFATREDIDHGMKLGAGHPMGPLQLCDFIGLDVLYAVCDSLYEEFKRDEYAPPPLMKRMVASGRLGRKSGRGFYEYD